MAFSYLFDTARVNANTIHNVNTTPTTAWKSGIELARQLVMHMSEEGALLVLRNQYCKRSGCLLEKTMSVHRFLIPRRNSKTVS